jgi:hypothetical protein
LKTAYKVECDLLSFLKPSMGSPISYASGLRDQRHQDHALQLHGVGRRAQSSKAGRIGNEKAR